MPVAKCNNCDEEWPTWLEYEQEAIEAGFLQQDRNARRQALRLRVRGLVEIITGCPLDRLYEVEAWFDELETAFGEPPSWAVESAGVFRENSK
jgi:hypothetical protein